MGVPVIVGPLNTPTVAAGSVSSAALSALDRASSADVEQHVNRYNVRREERLPTEGLPDFVGVLAPLTRVTAPYMRPGPWARRCLAKGRTEGPLEGAQQEHPGRRNNIAMAAAKVLPPVP